MSKEYKDRCYKPLRDGVAEAAPATCEPESEPVDLEDLYVSGQFYSASVQESGISTDLGFMPCDLDFTVERAKDLRDVLDQAIEFHETYFSAE